MGLILESGSLNWSRTHIAPYEGESWSSSDLASAKVTSVVSGDTHILETLLALV